MWRSLLVAIALMVAAIPAQAGLIQYDIAGIAAHNNAWYGVQSGDTLSGTLSIDDAVRHGKGRTGDVDSFEFRIGNTVFDTTNGNFEVSYELRNDELFKLNIHAKPQEFRRDFRQFLLNMTPHDVTLKAKDLGNRWLYVTDIDVTRRAIAGPYLDFGNGLSLTSSVSEASGVALMLLAIGSLAAVGRRSRTA